IDHQLHIRQIKVHGHVDSSIAIISSKLANPSLSKQELASSPGSGKVNGIVMNTDTDSCLSTPILFRTFAMPSATFAHSSRQSISARSTKSAHTRKRSSTH